MNITSPGSSILPNKSNPGVTSSGSSDLEQSLSVLDLQGVSNDDVTKTPKYMEHSAIFDELVATTDVEYTTQRPPTLRRQLSARTVTVSGKLRRGSNSNKKKKVNEKKASHVRRHSSFESHEVLKHYNHHKEVKEFLDSCKHLERAKFIQSLLDFNLSVNMASQSGDFGFFLDKPDVGTTKDAAMAALHHSCPVLSYMNDDEEDSVDLIAYKLKQNRKGTKRSSLWMLEENSQEVSWETLNDDEDEVVAEYSVELQPLEGEDESKTKKKRRQPSCQLLSKRLSTEHPQDVLRSLGVFEQ